MPISLTRSCLAVALLAVVSGTAAAEDLDVLWERYSASVDGFEEVEASCLDDIGTTPNSGVCDEAVREGTVLAGTLEAISTHEGLPSVDRPSVVEQLLVVRQRVAALLMDLGECGSAARLHEQILSHPDIGQYTDLRLCVQDDLRLADRCVMEPERGDPTEMVVAPETETSSTEGSEVAPDSVRTGSRRGALALGGTAAGLLVGAFAIDAAHWNEASALRSAPEGSHEAARLADTLRPWKATEMALLGVGGAAMVAGIVWYFVGGPDDLDVAAVPLRGGARVDVEFAF